MKNPRPDQHVLVTTYSPPRNGEVIRVCESDPHFYWVNVEGVGPVRVRGKWLKPVREKKR